MRNHFEFNAALELNISRQTQSRFAISRVKKLKDEGVIKAFLYRQRAIFRLQLCKVLSQGNYF